MAFELNESTGGIIINGNEYYEDYYGYDVFYKEVKDFNLSLIPVGKSFNLTEKIIGGSKKDYYKMSPSARYINNDLIGLYADLDICIADYDGNMSETQFAEYAQFEIERGVKNLNKHLTPDLILKYDSKIYEEIAYFTISVKLNDMSFYDAVSFMTDIETCFLSEGANNLKKSLFICHASEDKKMAEDVFRSLKQRGFTVWFDKYEILVGDSIVEEVSKGLDDTTDLIIILSSISVQKKWVIKELNTILMNKLSGSEIRILPFKIDQCKIPTLLAEYKYSDLKNGFENCIDELAKAVRGK